MTRDPETKGLIELTINKSVPLGECQVEKLVWEGTEFPWPIKQVDVETNMYDGYHVRVFFSNGEMEFWPTRFDYIDNTPPVPKCDTCGQDWKDKPEPSIVEKLVRKPKKEFATCSCGDWSHRASGGTCGPNGCYNRPA